MALDWVSNNQPEGGTLICTDSQALLKAAAVTMPHQLLGLLINLTTVSK